MNKFLLRTLTLLLVSILAVSAFMQGDSQAAVSGRQYVSGMVGLELNGAFVGWLSYAEGGNITTDIIEEAIGPDGTKRKHISGVRFENITLMCGNGMSDGFYVWIKDFLGMKKVPANGAIVHYDFNFKETRRMEFINSEIIEVDFPALDTGSKEQGLITVIIKPEYVKNAKPSNSAKANTTKASANRWLLSNYKLQIDGLTTDKVNLIDEIKIRRVGYFNEYSNLIITFPETAGETFINWAEEFIVKGNNGQNKEKTGTIDYLDHTRSKVLFTLTFHNLGIYMVSPKIDDKSSIARMQAGMYCEKIDIEYKEITK